MPAEHWWAALIEIAAVAAIVALSFGPLATRRRAADVILKLIGTYILIYKLWEYGGAAFHGAKSPLPIDFSAVTYFMFGLSVWAPFKTFKKVASSAAFLTGLVYSLAFVVFTEAFYAKAPPNHLVFMAATVNHTLMFFGALLALSDLKLEKSDALKIPLGFALFVLYAYIAVYVTDVVTNAVVFDIAEGRIVSYVINGIEYTAGFYVLYYSCCAVALMGVLALLYYLNRRLYCPKSLDAPLYRHVIFNRLSDRMRLYAKNK